MKGMNQKNIIKISLTLFLSMLTIFAVYGIGWTLSGEQNALLALAKLPSNQLWKINGEFSLLTEQLNDPVVFPYQAELKYSMESGEMESQWKVDGQVFGNFDFLNLAFSEGKWLIEFPAMTQQTVWRLTTGKPGLTQEEMINWLKQLQLEKQGYINVEREYGGNVSCLHLQSQNNVIPEKLLSWLNQVVDADLDAEKRVELQELLTNHLKMIVNFYLTPDLEIMESEIHIILEDKMTLELVLKARPEPSSKPDLSHLQERNVIELDKNLLEDFMDILKGLEKEEMK